MILVIDNYDSFTYNLVQYLGELGCDIVVHRNDQISLAQIETLKPDHILISPGPGDPDDAGISLALLKHFHQNIPILGVCLGHQAIGQAFGGKVIRANSLMHGKTSLIQHNKQGIFANVPSPFTATRYHSLVVDETLPTCLTVTARTPSGEMMGLSHNTYPTVGVQFHPESILTEHGHLMLKNFLEMNTMTIKSNTESKETKSDTTQSESTTSSVPPQTEKNTAIAFSINQALNKILNRKHLYEEEAEAVMTQIMTGNCTEAQIGAYLTALRMKGETVTEIVGSARAMRNAAITVNPTTTDLIDTCGTGGDGTGSFNISTTTAFVVAGAGQPVAKHGNRSVSSRAGSADVLEALGVNLNLTPAQVADSIDQVGLGFMFAPKLHPAMKYAIGPRRQLGVRTIFNILGPLTNPAGAKAQIMGVYDADLTEVIARVLGGLGSKAAFVVHGHGGLDELTTSGPNQVSLLQNGKVTTTTLDPESLGFRRSTTEDMLGGDADQNATITRNILSGEDKSPRRDVVLLNTAAALVAGGKAKSLTDGIALATESIDTGSALSVLEKLIDFTQQFINY